MSLTKYRRRTPIVEAAQFNYIDGIDGPETRRLAKFLGLSRNKGFSLLWATSVWEALMTGSWRTVTHGDWIVIDGEGARTVCEHDVFESMYELAE